MKSLKKFHLLITLLFLVIIHNETCAASKANPKSFIPDAPIINFRLPMFNKEGFQIWHIHGEKGIYVNEKQVDIIGMKLNTFSGQEKNRAETSIDSPKATVFLYDNKAQSQDEINVHGNGYNLSGKNWSWNGKSKKIIINQNVKIVFNKSLSNLYAYEKI